MIITRLRVHLLRNAIAASLIVISIGAAVAITRHTPNGSTAQEVTTESANSPVSGAAPPTCRPNQVVWSEPPPELSAGADYQIFVLQNVSFTACSLQGVPQVSQTDSAGHQFINDLASQTTSGLVDLASQAKASFYIGFFRCATLDFSYGSRPTVETVSIPQTGIQASFDLASGPSCAAKAAQTSPVVAGIVSVPGWETGGSPPGTVPGAYAGPPKTTLPSPPGNLPVSTTQP